MRSKYWSCTRLADKIRGTPKPQAATSEQWDAWHDAAEKKHPIRYAIAEEYLNKIQGLLHWPLDKMYNVKYWFNNRWITRTHALTSHSLEKGTWHDLDRRILHCLFDELVNYVEIELAWSNISWDEKAREQFKPPFWAHGWFRMRVWRSAECGLNYLNWASNLKEDETWGIEPSNERFGTPTTQAINAQETLALYNWWKTVRPARPDPDQVSGWAAWCATSQSLYNGKRFYLSRESSPEREEQVKSLLDKTGEIEKQYFEEDQEMLIRLIKIRSSLWT